MVINGMPTVIQAFMEARIRIQNDLDELETWTGKKSKMLFNKGEAWDGTVQWV